MNPKATMPQSQEPRFLPSSPPSPHLPPLSQSFDNNDDDNDEDNSLLFSQPTSQPTASMMLTSQLTQPLTQNDDDDDDQDDNDDDEEEEEGNDQSDNNNDDDNINNDAGPVANVANEANAANVEASNVPQTTQTTQTQPSQLSQFSPTQSPASHQSHPSNQSHPSRLSPMPQTQCQLNPSLQLSQSLQSSQLSQSSIQPRKLQMLSQTSRSSPTPSDESNDSQESQESQGSQGSNESKSRKKKKRKKKKTQPTQQIQQPQKTQQTHPMPTMAIQNNENNKAKQIIENHNDFRKDGKHGKNDVDNVDDVEVEEVDDVDDVDGEDDVDGAENSSGAANSIHAESVISAENAFSAENANGDNECDVGKGEKGETGKSGKGAKERNVNSLVNEFLQAECSDIVQDLGDMEEVQYMQYKEYKEGVEDIQGAKNVQGVDSHADDFRNETKAEAEAEAEDAMGANDVECESSNDAEVHAKGAAKGDATNADAVECVQFAGDEKDARDGGNAIDGGDARDARNGGNEGNGGNAMKVDNDPMSPKHDDDGKDGENGQHGPGVGPVGFGVQPGSQEPLASTGEKEPKAVSTPTNTSLDPSNVDVTRFNGCNGSNGSKSCNDVTRCNTCGSTQNCEADVDNPGDYYCRSCWEEYEKNETEDTEAIEEMEEMDEEKKEEQIEEQMEQQFEHCRSGVAGADSVNGVNGVGAVEGVGAVGATGGEVEAHSPVVKDTTVSKAVAVADASTETLAAEESVKAKEVEEAPEAKDAEETEEVQEAREAREAIDSTEATSPMVGRKGVQYLNAATPKTSNLAINGDLRKESVVRSSSQSKSLGANDSLGAVHNGWGEEEKKDDGVDSINIGGDGGDGGVNNDDDVNNDAGDDNNDNNDAESMSVCTQDDLFVESKSGGSGSDFNFGICNGLLTQAADDSDEEEDEEDDDEGDDKCEGKSEGEGKGEGKDQKDFGNDDIFMKDDDEMISNGERETNGEVDKDAAPGKENESKDAKEAAVTSVDRLANMEENGADGTDDASGSGKESETEKAKKTSVEPLSNMNEDGATGIGSKEAFSGLTEPSQHDALVVGSVEDAADSALDKKEIQKDARAASSEPSKNVEPLSSMNEDDATGMGSKDAFSGLTEPSQHDAHAAHAVGRVDNANNTILSEKEIETGARAASLGPSRNDEKSRHVSDAFAGLTEPSQHDALVVARLGDTAHSSLDDTRLVTSVRDGSLEPSKNDEKSRSVSGADAEKTLWYSMQVDSSSYQGLTEEEDKGPGLLAHANDEANDAEQEKPEDESQKTIHEKETKEVDISLENDQTAEEARDRESDLKSKLSVANSVSAERDNDKTESVLRGGQKEGQQSEMALDASESNANGHEDADDSPRHSSQGNKQRPNTANSQLSSNDAIFGSPSKHNEESQETVATNASDGWSLYGGDTQLLPSHPSQPTNSISKDSANATGNLEPEEPLMGNGQDSIAVSNDTLQKTDGATIGSESNEAQAEAAKDACRDDVPPAGNRHNEKTKERAVEKSILERSDNDIDMEEKNEEPDAAKDKENADLEVGEKSNGEEIMDLKQTPDNNTVALFSYPNDDLENDDACKGNDVGKRSSQHAEEGAVLNQNIDGAKPDGTSKTSAHECQKALQTSLPSQMSQDLLAPSPTRPKEASQPEKALYGNIERKASSAKELPAAEASSNGARNQDSSSKMDSKTTQVNANKLPRSNDGNKGKESDDHFAEHEPEEITPAKHHHRTSSNRKMPDESNWITSNRHIHHEKEDSSPRLVLPTFNTSGKKEQNKDDRKNEDDSDEDSWFEDGNYDYDSDVIQNTPTQDDWKESKQPSTLKRLSRGSSSSAKRDDSSVNSRSKQSSKMVSATTKKQHDASAINNSKNEITPKILHYGHETEQFEPEEGSSSSESGSDDEEEFNDDQGFENTQQSQTDQRIRKQLEQLKPLAKDLAEELKEIGSRRDLLDEIKNLKKKEKDYVNEISGLKSENEKLRKAVRDKNKLLNEQGKLLSSFQASLQAAKGTTSSPQKRTPQKKSPKKRKHATEEVDSSDSDDDNSLPISALKSARSEKVTSAQKPSSLKKSRISPSRPSNKVAPATSPLKVTAAHTASRKSDSSGRVKLDNEKHTPLSSDIWKVLKEKGWKYRTGPEPHNKVYVPRDGSTHAGTKLGIHFFTSDQVVAAAIKRGDLRANNEIFRERSESIDKSIESGGQDQDEEEQYPGHAVLSCGTPMDDSTLYGTLGLTLESAQFSVMLASKFMLEDQETVSFVGALFNPLWQRLKEQGSDEPEEIHWRYGPNKDPLATRNWCFVPPLSKKGEKGKKGKDYFVSEEQVVLNVLEEVKTMVSKSFMLADLLHEHNVCVNHILSTLSSVADDDNLSWKDAREGKNTSRRDRRAKSTAQADAKAAPRQIDSGVTNSGKDSSHKSKQSNQAKKITPERKRGRPKSPKSASPAKKRPKQYVSPSFHLTQTQSDVPLIPSFSTLRKTGPLKGYSFFYSGVQDPFSTKKIIESLGGEAVQEPRVLNATAAQGKVFFLSDYTSWRKMKYILAASLGVPMLHSNWLSDIEKQYTEKQNEKIFSSDLYAKHRLPLGLDLSSGVYILQRATNARHWIRPGFSVNGGKPIFEGLTIALAVDSSLERDWKPILSSCGARLVTLSSLPKSKGQVSVDCCLFNSAALPPHVTSLPTYASKMVAALDDEPPFLDLAWAHQSIIQRKRLPLVGNDRFSVSLTGKGKVFAIKTKSGMRIEVGDIVQFCLNPKGEPLRGRVLEIIPAALGQDFQLEVLCLKSDKHELIDCPTSRRARIKSDSVVGQVVMLKVKDFKRLGYVPPADQTNIFQQVVPSNESQL